MIDLKTGADRTYFLRVPYTGKLSEPKSNYTRTQSPQGKDCWQALGPYILGITGLHIDGKRLQITLGMKKWARTVEFDIDESQTRK